MLFLLFSVLLRSALLTIICVTILVDNFVLAFMDAFLRKKNHLNLSIFPLNFIKTFFNLFSQELSLSNSCSSMAMCLITLANLYLLLLNEGIAAFNPKFWLQLVQMDHFVLHKINLVPYVWKRIDLLSCLKNELTWLPVVSSIPSQPVTRTIVEQSKGKQIDVQKTWFKCPHKHLIDYL